MDQSDNGISLEAQQAKLESYANLYDLTVVEKITDAGESAKSLNRAGLQRALQWLRSDKADGLLIAKLDRLSRSVLDWQLLIRDFFSEKAGKQLFSVADCIDTRTAAGRLVLNIMAAISEWEREAVSERTKEVLQHKIRNGKRVGKVRFGHDLAPDGTSLVANPSEQETIALILELRAAGRTLRQIAAMLSERGILTKEGRTTWTHTAVARIVKREKRAA